MKKLFTFSIALASFFVTTNAQTAMQISGLDCYDNPMDMFADLDAGKAVILHFYMPDCGSCPPPATKIQTMANNIMETYPGMVKGYAFPFQNSTTCDYSASWVEDNDLTFYTPMDSGALAVAYYGGFGMPTVVLLGGTDHRVMFSTLSFVNSDTTEMADSILALFGGTTDILNEQDLITNLTLVPNPANSNFEIRANLSENGNVIVELLDLTGKTISLNAHTNVAAGKFAEVIDTNQLPNGFYMVRLTAGDAILMKQVVIAH